MCFFFNLLSLYIDDLGSRFCRFLSLAFFYFIPSNPPLAMNRSLKYACPLRDQGCSKRFRSQGGRTYHIRTCHINYNIIRRESPEPVAPATSRPVSPTSLDGSSLDLPIQDRDMDIPQPPSPSPPPPTHPKKEYHPWLTGEHFFLPVICTIHPQKILRKTLRQGRCLFT